jgi:hypothetical protein
MSGASGRTRNRRFRRSRGSEWSGAGSNRRPSAFQGSYHPRDHDLKIARKPSSSALPLFSQPYCNHNGCAAEYRIVPFRLWASCGAFARPRTCGAFVGLAIPILDGVISGDVVCNGIHLWLRTFGQHAHVVVSEPLNDLPGAFIEVPESTVAVLDDSGYHHHPFLDNDQ